MEQVQPLVQYLETHGWINSKEADVLRESVSREELVSSLRESGVLSASEIERLESLFAAFPRYRGDVDTLALDTLRTVPYALASKHRIACVDTGHEGIALATDNSVLDPGLERALGMRIASVYRVGRDEVDQALERYKREVVSEIDSSIERTARSVRRVESYGSRSMALFFPQDHKREIAEDLSSLKLLRQLVARARIDGADMLIIRPGTDKVAIESSRAGEVSHTVSLPKAVEGPLYLKMRYLADLSLEECTRTQTAELQGIGASNEERFAVDFIPQSNGITMVVRSSEETPDRVLLARAGLGETDINILTDLIARGNGMVSVTGLSGSGKTFAAYHLIEAASQSRLCTTLEASIEYVVDGVDQTTYSKRPDKDLRDVPSYYQVLGLFPARSDMLQAVYNLAQRKLVVLDFQEGVLAALKRLVRIGISARDIARVLQYNLVSYRYPMLEQKARVAHKLSAGEIATLEEYCSRAELGSLLQEEGVRDKELQSWTDVTWYDKKENHVLWWNTRSQIHNLAGDDASYHYVRAVVPIGEVISEASRSGLSMVDTDYQIQYAQKRAIARRSLVRAARGEVAMSDVLAMLRA